MGSKVPIATGAADAPAPLRRAVGLLGADPAAAETLAREALHAAPQSVDARIVIGTALRLRGDFEGARAVFEPLAVSQAASWIVLFELAQCLFALGRTHEAVEPLCRATALNPALAAAWRLLGDILLASGQFQAARHAYDRQLRATIGDPRLTAPAEALAEGRLSVAEHDLRAVLARDPASLTAAHLLGEVLDRQGRLGDAERLLAECVAQAPTFDAARRSHALVLLGAGRYREALAQLDDLFGRDPHDHRCRMIRAAALTESGDHAAAAAVTAALLAVFPDQPQVWLLHAHGLRTLGRAGEAIAAFRRCVALDPDRGDAWWGLASLKTYRFAPAERATIEARLARPALRPERRAQLHFALGKAREDAGEPAAAFDGYARANAIERARRAYDPNATSRLVRSARALFTPSFLAQRAGWGDAAPDPTFIVGLPRSGSTLVDQILASHPAVEGLGELPDLQQVADLIGGPRTTGGSYGYPDRVDRLSRGECEQLGRDYLTRTRARRRPGATRFTDKAPWNFLHIGLIRLILPGAKIIDVRRHPMACCVSAFSQHFARGSDFTHDLADLGRYYADYVDLMAHFDTVAAGAVHRVIYEDLIADTEAQVRRLLAFLDLPFDPACLHFFDNRRAVATPSSEQVRRPIYTDAVDRWRAFEPWLGPLKAALGPVLDAWPAAPPER